MRLTGDFVQRARALAPLFIVLLSRVLVHVDSDAATGQFFNTEFVLSSLSLVYCSAVVPNAMR